MSFVKLIHTNTTTQCVQFTLSIQAYCIQKFSFMKASFWALNVLDFYYLSIHVKDIMKITINILKLGKKNKS